MIIFYYQNYSRWRGTCSYHFVPGPMHKRFMHLNLPTKLLGILTSISISMCVAWCCPYGTQFLSYCERYIYIYIFFLASFRQSNC
uniref:Uncharacterized protein n=1 Tax=Lepeophtheirus salmonis TaxID=72036 RepID=A0A0K2VAK6_LEPSM